MKVISTEKRFCQCCMEEHDVQKVLLRETNRFKGVPVEYDAAYFYCDRACETYADEELVSANDVAMKDAYRRVSGLLATDEIIGIRSRYGITQSDLCLLLGWGGKTVTRYESHQVQDNAHDTILKKLRDDPEWFLTLLESAKPSLVPAAYAKYYKAGIRLYENDGDSYLRRAILARYAPYMDRAEFSGDRKLALDVVADAIRYFANSASVTSLYKVKLMKLLWYTDALSYKRRGHAVTGMVYQALPMGAVPIAHDTIIELSDIRYEEMEIGDGTAYKFLPTEDKDYRHLGTEDKDIMDAVICRFGRASKGEIVAAMHREGAYAKTAPGDIIRFGHAMELSLA